MAFARIRLEVNEWPPGDRAAWLAARQAGDPLDDPGLASHWTGKSSDTVSRVYGIWLAWLRDTRRLDERTTPGVRVNREVLNEYIEWMASRTLSPVTMANRIRDLAEAIRVMDPGADRTILHHVLRRLGAKAVPLRDKRCRILSPAVMAPAVIRYLRRHRPAGGTISRREAGRYRDALIVAILIYRPIRLANLTAMQMGRHLEKRGETYRCAFTAAETKAHLALEFPMPAVLTPWIDLYLSTCRPALLRDRVSQRLWISTRDTPMSDNTVHCRVCHFTEQVFGQTINPHLFRDCAATFIAEVDPEHVRIIARILGHATLKSAEHHYNHAGMLSAQSRYLDALSLARD